MHVQDEIIAGRRPGEKGQPAHHRQIVTIFGLYGRAGSSGLAVATVIRLMRQAGAEPTSVRSSVSRLKRRGVLVSTTVGTQRGYSLSPELSRHFVIGDQRIFRPKTAALSDPWLLVTYSVPESDRSIRHKLRNGLARLGFGAVAPGLVIAPAHLRPELLEFIEAYDLEDYVQYFSAQPEGPGELRRSTAQWWDLQALESHYAEFLDQYAGLDPLWREKTRGGTQLDHLTDEDLRSGFRDHLQMFTAWRRLPYLDPGLPQEVLPAGWKGFTARDLFRALEESLSPVARHYAEEVIAGRLD